ncbi:RHS repeat-associated core domain-containing protein [Streptosporangium sp. NPDC023825]|uniref:RHS repeat-associated core domain-containing protein n=1 Tax=Streptosporangium sp. NPDC023825 TaxID=3154909 RepID=UPI0034479D2B
MSGTHSSTQLAINDATGAINRERYLPFGQRRGEDDLPFTDRGFLGKSEAAATSLNYLDARYYDPTIAKFISTDPLLDPRKFEFGIRGSGTVASMVASKAYIAGMFRGGRGGLNSRSVGW